MTAKVFQLLLHDAHTDGNSNPRQGNITAPAVRTSSSPRGVRRTPSRSATCRNPFPKPQMLWAASYHAAKSQRECVCVTYRRTNYTNNRMPFPLWGRLGTSFQCHYMALWNCSHVSCDRMHCIIIVETASFPHEASWSKHFQRHWCSERWRALCARRRRSGARTPLRGLSAALAPLHVVCDPLTGCLFQMVMGPGTRTSADTHDALRRSTQPLIGQRGRLHAEVRPERRQLRLRAPATTAT